MQVLADAPLLQRGDFHDLAFQFLSPGDVAEDAGEEIQMFHLADRQVDRERGAVLALGHDLPADADDMLHPVLA